MTVLILTDKGKKAVLVVDDEPVERNLMVSVLTDSYQVLEADSLSEALSISNGFESGIDLLIADHSLTTADFVRLTRQLQLRRPALKVLRIRVDTKQGPAPEEELLSGTWSLARPFSSSELSEKVGQILSVKK